MIGRRVVSVTCRGVLAIALVAKPGIGQQPTFDAVLNAAKPTTLCTFDQVPGTKCHGFPRSDLWSNQSDASNRRLLADWAKSLTFVKKKSGVFRPKSQSQEIDQIDDIEKVWLKDFAAVPPAGQALFVARISADMSQDPDAQYHIGRQKTAITAKDFYIVIDGYSPDKKTYRHNSYQVGTFSIYTIQAAQSPSGIEYELKQLGKKKGKFRMCGEAHSATVKQQGAQFKSCPGATREGTALQKYPQLAAAMRGTSLHDALSRYTADRSGVRAFFSAEIEARQMAFATQFDLFVKQNGLSVTQEDRAAFLRILNETSDGPAWMPCGVGCCTADDK